MSAKIIRDPVYNYISIDRKRDGWLLDVLDAPEVQRLRRIHQLGLSHLTYPGADHNRLAHSLGVMHLMTQATRRLGEVDDLGEVEVARPALLAAGLLHDVGHGPFSHLAETCLGFDHEERSRRIILSEASGVGKALRRFDPGLPAEVAALVGPGGRSWRRDLLSSQLDMDRVDYLRRDSLFTGASYGHFDWQRLVDTTEIDRDEPAGASGLVWLEKSILAVEEYVISRFYMYQNVYLHKTTRGFERIVEAIFRRARMLHDSGVDVAPSPAIRRGWDEPDAALDPRAFLAVEEFTVLSQVQAWADHLDPSLADLSRRFLDRERFAMVEPPRPPLGADLADLDDDPEAGLESWHQALRGLVARRGYRPVEMYCLVDRVDAKFNRPYVPDGPGGSIRIRVDGEPRPVEVSRLLPKLAPLTRSPVDRVCHYIPRDLKPEALRLRDRWREPSRSGGASLMA